MNKQSPFELLAPGGDIESIKSAIAAGADAIYCGLDNFNARNRAKNLCFDEFNGVIKLAHERQCQIFLTLNIIILEHEFTALIRLLNKLVNTHVDALIVQDIGLFYLLKHHYPSLDVHASTQVTTHNNGQIEFFNRLNVSRVNLSRELSIDEIKTLTAVGHQHNMLSEVFVHGSYCIGFSGLCYISSAHGGNSGNRGRCSQPCRDQYVTTSTGRDFPLNLKDNSAFFDLPALADAGVDSLKVEGRIKDFHYVYTVIDSWRQQIDRFINQQPALSDDSALYKVFNRDLSNGYLAGHLSKSMFIDNPRNHSLQHFSQQQDSQTNEQIQAIKQGLYDEKTQGMQFIRSKISGLSIAKTPLSLRVAGSINKPLTICIIGSNIHFTLESSSTLRSGDKYSINREVISKRLKNLNIPDFEVTEIHIEQLAPELFIPFKELTQIKNQLVFRLNGERSPIAAVELPPLTTSNNNTNKATLSVLIDSKRDLALCELSGVDIYYKLPDSIGTQAERLLKMFKQNIKLLPWFPSILIGADFEAAVNLLKQLEPNKIVTNNTGIAFEAYKRNISWIAGPQMNITNSYSLQAVQQEFNAKGSFISNELNKKQMRHIKRPDNFELYYSLYHPMMLLSSRQCLFHQTSGCNEKSVMDEACLAKCKKTSSIINLKGTGFTIDKQNHRHNCIYNDEDFLNLDIIKDLPELFTGYFIDLSRVKTATQCNEQKPELIQLFKQLLQGDDDANMQLNQQIQPTTNKQYAKGL